MTKRKEIRLPVELGSRVRKRGFDHLGTVDKISGNWVNAIWDKGRGRETPRICFNGELEVLPLEHLSVYILSR